MNLTRGDKKIKLSLQGCGMPFPENQDENWLAVCRGMGLKYFGLFEGSECVYQDWFGRFPDNEILEKFIK